jgi:small subunit ribosomal protein S4e
MARGPKKHLKRLAAPKSWMLDKMGGIFAPRPSQGPHKLRESIPLVVLLRNRLKYALTRRETLMIVMNRLIQVDGKVRTDANFPAGLMDVVSIQKSNEHYRLLYDSKGRFVLHKIQPDEAAFKLVRVQRNAVGGRGYMGVNPLAKGRETLPYLVTNDGRTIRYPDPEIKANDTLKLDTATNKIVEFYKFQLGQVAIVTGGNNVGRVGVIVNRERHIGSFEIIHLKDKNGAEFATRLRNVFVIGNGNQPAISLPKRKGIRLSINEEKEQRLKKAGKGAAKN